MTPAQSAFLTAAIKEIPAIFGLIVQLVAIKRRGDEPLIVARPRPRSADQVLDQAEAELRAEQGQRADRDTDPAPPGDELLDNDGRADIPSMVESSRET